MQGISFASDPAWGRGRVAGCEARCVWRLMLLLIRLLAEGTEWVKEDAVLWTVCTWAPGLEEDLGRLANKGMVPGDQGPGARGSDGH